ncbi:MAG: cytochrome b [Rhizobiaceae bacterium]|nr:cytochrome b [Rhizobiaceae bacterium]
MALDPAVAGASAPISTTRYDRWTICLHWLSAILVIGLFAAAYIWNSLPPGTPLRKWLQAIHISFGLVFTVVFVLRLFWRSAKGRHFARDAGAVGILSKGMHILLYVLLTAQVLLGFLLRWAQGEPFLFFGLFSVPSLFGPDKGLAHIFEWLHNYTAWTIIILAAGHAVAALTHHYLLRDGVLKRMLPIG